MTFAQHLVSPKLPTLLAGDTHVELPGHDSWLLWLDNVHVIPAQLDVSKFEDALSRVLQVYPHATGQLRRTDGCWSIELTDTVIPVDVVYKFDSNPHSILMGDWVIQDDLSPLLNPQPIGTDDVVNGSVPLLRFKLTFFAHETCIGVSWNHSIGDAFMMSCLMHMLSQFYQGLPSKFGPPAFKKHHFPTPSATLSSPLHPTRPFDGAAWVESLKELEPVRWRIGYEDLEELRSTLSSDAYSNKYLSKHDCLIAYFIAVLSHSRGNPVRKVTNVCSYRRVKAPFISENLAGNSMVNIRTTVPKDMAGIAAAVRDAIVQSRDPDCLYTLETLQSARMLEAVNAGKLISISFDEDELFVNSNVVIDWRSADFGYPDSARFHTHGYFMDVMRCFQSNPARGDDGAWTVRPKSIDVGLGVPGRLKPKVMETLSRGIQYMLDKERAQS